MKKLLGLLTLWFILWTGTANADRMFMAGSSSAVVSASTAGFIPAVGTGAQQATNEGDVTTTVPIACVAHNLRCDTTGVTGTTTVAGGTNYVFALDQNLVAGALTCTEGAAVKFCTDTTHYVPLAIGDQVDILVTPSGTPTALVVKCSFECDTSY